MIADLKKRAIHRSRILQGQMTGLEKMIEKEEYCVDILTQILAVQRSLGSLNKLMLENHLRTHVKEQMKDTHESEDLINELLGLYELNNIKSK
jgi:DNA-binding FrmR family transcriptional regulator